MEDLTFVEFFRKKCNGTLEISTSEEMCIFDKLKKRKDGGFGTYRNVKTFEKIYNKYIKGKVYMPADDCPFGGKSSDKMNFGFVINRDGTIDMVRVRAEKIIEFLKEQVV